MVLDEDPQILKSFQLACYIRRSLVYPGNPFYAILAANKIILPLPCYSPEDSLVFCH